jgi:hypothetical protein
MLTIYALIENNDERHASYFTHLESLVLIAKEICRYRKVSLSPATISQVVSVKTLLEVIKDRKLHDTTPIPFLVDGPLRLSISVIEVHD